MMQAFILFLALAGAVYPPARDEHLNDFAGVVARADQERVRSLAREVLRAQRVPIVVATISSLADQDAAGWSIERYATNLYNEWGIGERGANRGVLLLVAVRDRKLRIATGTALGNREADARQVIDTVIVPRFKRGDLSGGIAAGVEAIAAWFAPRAEAEAEPPAAALPPERMPSGEGARWSPNGTGVIRNTERGGGIAPFFKVFLVLVAGAVIVSISLSRRAIGGGPMTGGYVGGGRGWGGGWGSGRGGGWTGFLLGGLAGFLGSQLLSGGRRTSQWGGSGRGGGSSWGGGSFSGGGSSFGGGSSSGGGASGSW